ncbi:GNAT family N-acetyltransferase [Solitalea longa]|uniref:GNAT family N-acetyltransferase n=1 Tax=Solitalea longa TaxID=2079460 RepID=UPI001FAE8921|nr:GNAT family protein [Solitalea longa]
MYDKQSGQYAGCTRFGEMALNHKRAEIGWTWIGPEFQGTGLNKSVKFELLNYAFDILDLNRIEIKTDELNLKSQNAIKSIGAIYEGTFRKHAITWSGRVRNSVYFSIIKEDWPRIKLHLLTKLNAFQV